MAGSKQAAELTSGQALVLERLDADSAQTPEQTLSRNKQEDDIIVSIRATAE